MIGARCQMCTVFREIVRSFSLRSATRHVLCLLSCMVAVVLVPQAAFAQITNPVPSGELCPDGTPRMVWTYPFEVGVPGNATPLQCAPGETCYAFPQSSCLQVFDQSSVLHPERNEEPGNPPKSPDTLLPPRLREPHGPVAGKPTSVGDDGFDVPDRPLLGCTPGTGWDFETGKDYGVEEKVLRSHADFQEWFGSRNGGSPFDDLVNQDVNIIAAPVYGNAVPINRIKPPGWVPGIEQQIGGDYWLYSQSINYHGDYWVSSRYRRYSWGQHPGVVWDVGATGTLTSPPCILMSRYLTFRMSGGRESSQRVEVQIERADPAEYFGINFPGSLGDPNSGGALGHATQFVSAPGVQNFPPIDGDWVAVRSVTSEDRKQGDWMQTYVFDLEPFEGRPVRVRVVDDVHRGDFGFINVDDFRWANTPPPDVKWLTFDRERCGGVRGTGEGCSPVGHVPSEPPLWGVTDAHAHPMANLAFGGHVFWGDVSDSLDDVYDCSRSLQAIPGPGGREAIPEASVTSSCFIAGDVTVIVTAAAIAGCSPLAAIPVFGVGASVLCKGILGAAEAVLLTTPVVRGLTYHGATKFPIGALFAGDILKRSWIGYLQLIGQEIGDFDFFAPGLLATTDDWPNAKPSVDWYPKDKKWHNHKGLGITHNHYQADMIRRAHAGGMRLAVWDVINSRALAMVADGDRFASDWQALKDQTDAAKRIVDTTLSSIARIAYSPQEAASIIREGKLAVILGSEVDELGRMRPDGFPWPRSPHTSGDSMQKQIDDLWELGIRKVTPVHAVNNPIGGTAIFIKDYVANNHFVNATPLDGKPSFTDGPVVRFTIDRLPGTILGSLLQAIVLGETSIVQTVGGDGKTPWNPQGWFEIDGRQFIVDSIVGETELVTYRIGEDDPPDPPDKDPNDPSDTKRLKDRSGNWFAPQQILNEQILLPNRFNTLATFIRPIGRCDMYGSVIPTYAKSFGPVVDAQFTASDGHRNKLGVFRDGGDDGEAFLRALMKKGMVLDVDHLSQNMRDDVYRLSGAYAREAQWPAVEGCPPGTRCGDYPVMGVHTTVRELEKEGSSLPHLIDAFGSNNESTRTPAEITHVARNLGTIGAFPRPVIIPPNTSNMQCTKASDCAAWNGEDDGAQCQNNKCVPQFRQTLKDRDFGLPAEVQNDCDGSSKTFATKYLWLQRQMRGKGVTFTSDFNGMNHTQFPRYGVSIPGKFACGAGGREQSLRDRGNWQYTMLRLQELEHSGIWYEDYSTRSPVVSALAANWEDPKRPDSNKRWKSVVARDVTDLREDRAPRYTKYSDQQPIRDRVYYNDFGPDLAPHNWMEQSGNRPGAQLFPMKRWIHSRSGWDFNLDGFQHIGLLPDLVQDMRNVGVQWEQLGPLFHGANDFIATWQRSVEIGTAHP